MDQYIGFRLHTGEYAIPITKVREIINLPEITRMPESPAYLTGITNLRGSVIPVVDLRRLIGLPAAAAEGGKIIVIASGRIVFGLLVDGISGVVAVDRSAVEPPDALVDGHGDTVEGVAKLDGRLVMLLDCKKLIPLEDVTLLEDYAAETGACDPASETAPADILSAKAYLERSKSTCPDDPRGEILDGIMAFMTAVSDRKYEQADEAIQTITRLGQGDLFREVGKITRKLHDSIKGFKDAFEPRLSEIAQNNIPCAVDRLQYVIDKTEEAANRTMSVVEKYILRMDELAGHLRRIEGPPESIDFLRSFKNGLEDDLTEVLTTQSFQDLTGQTIKKVIGLVHDLEDELVRLIGMYGLKIETGVNEPAVVAEKVSQAGVDELLKELGF